MEECHDYHDRLRPIESLRRNVNCTPEGCSYAPSAPLAPSREELFVQESINHYPQEASWEAPKRTQKHDTPLKHHHAETFLSEGHAPDDFSSLPPIEQLERKHTHKSKGFHDILSTESVEKYGGNSNTWLYGILFVILLVITLTVVLLLNSTNFFGTFNYPSWAPSRYVLSILWTVAFLFSIFGLWPLLGHCKFTFFMFCVMLNVFFILLYMIIVYVLGNLIFGFLVLIVALVFELFIIGYISKFSGVACGLQVPYFLVLLLLFIITLQIIFS